MTFSNFFSDFLGNLEWLDVIIGAVVLFAFAWVWYGPLFGKMWRQETGREMGSPDPMTMAKGFVKFFIFGLGIVLTFPPIHGAYGNPSATFETLIVTSFAVSFLLVGMALFSRVVWEGGSAKLWLIDWGFWFIGSVIYGYVVLDLLV